MKTLFEHFIRSMIVICAFTQFLCADDIYFNDGRILKNVKIVEENTAFVIVQTSEKKIKFSRDTISKIELHQYDPTIVSKYSSGAPDNGKQKANRLVKNGVYLEVGAPYIRIGSDFDGESILTTSTQVFAVPEIDKNFGYAFILGMTSTFVGMELGYIKSTHNGNWAGASADIENKMYVLDFLINGKPLMLLNNPARPIMRAGLYLANLIVHDGAGTATPTGTEISDASFTGLGFNLGGGVAYYLNRRLFLDVEVIYRLLSYASVKAKGFDRVTIKDGLKGSSLGFTIGLAFTL